MNRQAIDWVSAIEESEQSEEEVTFDLLPTRLALEPSIFEELKGEWLRKSQFELSSGMSTGHEAEELLPLDTGKAQESLRKIVPLVPRFSSKPSRFRALQKWEGHVREIKADMFVAELVDLDKVAPMEEAEIPLQEVSEEDRELLKIGAIFYWTIGYSESPAGTRRRAGEIRFRRLPAWTKREISEAERDAKEIIDALSWKNPDTAASSG